jgi:hypothetical protein
MGRIQDFRLGGAHLNKMRRAEGGAIIVGVFRVKNHDFTPKNPIFPILGGPGAPPPPGFAPGHLCLWGGGSGSEPETLVMIDTDCFGGCNSNYYTITTKTYHNPNL